MRRGLLVAILAAALALRFIGLNWGLPNDVNIGGAYYHPSYYGDETSWVLNIYYAWVGQRKLYDDMSVHLGHGPGAEYLNTAALAVGVATGYLQAPKMDRAGYHETRKHYHKNPELMRRVYFLPRALSALFGVATVFLVYWLGVRLAGESAGLIAAAVLAVTPLHVVFSHIARSDNYATFFAALTFVFAYRVYQHGRLRDFLIAGFVAGLSTGTKYPNCLFSLSIVVAAILRYSEKNPLKWIHLGWSVLMGIVGFILFVPASVVNPYGVGEGRRSFVYWLDENFKQLADPNHWADLRIDWWIGYGHEGMMKGMFGFVFPSVLTWTLYIVGTAAVLWTAARAIRRNRTWLLFIVPSIAYFLLSLRNNLLVERWMDMLMPSMALCVGFWVAAPRRSPDSPNSPAEEPPPSPARCPFKLPAQILVALAIAHAGLFSLAYVLGMSRTDTKSRAAVWMEENARPNTHVGMAKPQLQTTQTRLNWDKFSFKEVYYDLAKLEDTRPDYYILHSQDYRFFDLYPSSREELPAAWEFIKSFREERTYRKIAEFTNEARLGPLKFKVGGVSSWDWPFQTVTIYERKSG